MMAIIDSYSDNLVAERTFLGTPLKEIQPKTQQVNHPRKFSNGVGQLGMQPKLGELAVSGPDVRSAAKEHIPMPTNSGGRGGMRGNGEDVEQVLHPKNINSSLGGTHSLQLQPAAGWYAANKNRPTYTMPSNPININFHDDGDVYARAVKEKYSSPKLIITAIRPCEPSGTIPNVPSLAKSDGAQMKPTDIPRVNQTIKMEAEEPTRQQPFRQSAPIFARESRRLLTEANDRSTIADMESHIETLLQEQPLASRTSRTKQKMFDAMFYGKTVTEIYEILGKRKRSANNEGTEDRPLHKKVDQHGFTKQ
jgi:hypothetical protein